jgi:glycolate oxidase FAD binding subunit
VDEPKHSSGGNLSASPIDAFSACVGPGQVRRGRERDAVDDVIPESVVTAANTKDVEVTVRECLARKLALLPLGGATQIGFGNKPKRYDVKLSLSAMRRISARNPDDMTVTVDAGIPLSHLNEILTEDGQRVALDAGASHRTTLGGLAATDHRGRLAFRYGSPRDQILGMTVIDGRGRRLELGGRVVKNVAGYDLTRLFVGSFGSLGAITQITIRTYPLAAIAADLIFSFDSATDADEARGRIFASELPLAGFDARADISTKSEGWQLRCLIEGNAAEIAYQNTRLARLCGREPTDRLEIDALASSTSIARCVHADDESVAVRISASPASAIALVEKARVSLAGRFPAVRIDGHLGSGSFRFSCHTGQSTDALAFVRAIEKTCTDFAGSHTVTELAPAEIKTTLDVWGGVVPGLHLMKRIKRKFDPCGIFSPGRFVGRL